RRRVRAAHRRNRRNRGCRNRGRRSRAGRDSSERWSTISRKKKKRHYQDTKTPRRGAWCSWCLGVLVSWWSSSTSEFPAQCGFHGRLVAAVGPGAHGVGQPARQLRIVAADQTDSVAQRLGHAGAGALGDRRDGAVAAAEADGARQLFGER